MYRELTLVVDGNALLSPGSRHTRPHDNATRQHGSTHRVGALMSSPWMSPGRTPTVHWGRTTGGCGWLA